MQGVFSEKLDINVYPRIRGSIEMDRTALVISALFLMLLIVIFMPLATFLLMPTYFFETVMQMYKDVGIWIFFAVVFICQLSLMFVPVRLKKEKPVPRSYLWVPVVVSGLLFAIVITGALITLHELVYATKWAEDSKQDLFFMLEYFCFLLLLLWVVWTIVFWKMTANTSAKQFSMTSKKWLLHGSILNFLIAVPVHVYVRHKEYCCAGMWTFFSITMGISVMLIAFGPGVYVLYCNRVKAKKGQL